MSTNRTLVNPVGLPKASPVAPDTPQISQGSRLAKALGDFTGMAPKAIGDVAEVQKEHALEQYEEQIRTASAEDPAGFFAQFEETPDGWSGRKWDVFNKLKAEHDISTLQSKLNSAKEQYQINIAEAGIPYNADDLAFEYQEVMQKQALGTGKNPTYLKHFMPSASHMVANAMNGEKTAEIQRAREEAKDLSGSTVLNFLDVYNEQGMDDEQLAEAARNGLNKHYSDIKVLTGESDRSLAQPVVEKLVAQGRLDAARMLLDIKDADGIALRDTDQFARLNRIIDQATPDPVSVEEKMVRDTVKSYAPVFTTISELNRQIVADEVGPEGLAKRNELIRRARESLATDNALASPKVGAQLNRMSTNLTVLEKNIYSQGVSDPTIYGELMTAAMLNDPMLNVMVLNNVEYLTEKDYETFSTVYLDPDKAYMDQLTKDINRTFGIEYETAMGKLTGLGSSKTIVETTSTVFKQVLFEDPEFQRAYAEADPKDRRTMVKDAYKEWSEGPGAPIIEQMQSMTGDDDGLDVLHSVLFSTTADVTTPLGDKGDLGL